MPNPPEEAPEWFDEMTDCVEVDVGVYKKRKEKKK